MNKEKLKPCPFCGGEAVLKIYQNYEHDISFAYVYCGECGAKINCYASQEAAAERWNGRVNKRAESKWIIGSDEYGFGKYDQCSACGYKLNAIGAASVMKMRYCPGCGARMEYTSNGD